MKRIAIFALLLAALSGSVFGQIPGGAYSSPAIGSSSSGVTSVATLPATCTPFTTAPVMLNVAPGGIYYCSATNTWTQANSPIDARYFGVQANTQWVNDATTTSTTGVVTSPTAAFTAADTGKSGWALNTTGASITGTGLQSCTVTYNSATQITLGCNNTVALSGTATFIWGTNDDAAANAATTALLALNTCGTIIWPNGYMYITSNKYLTYTSTKCGALNDDMNGTEYDGQGFKSTYFLLGPDFNWAGVGNGIIGSTRAGHWRNFNVTALGLKLPSAANGKTIIAIGNDSAASRIAVTQMVPNSAVVPISMLGAALDCEHCFVDTTAGTGTNQISIGGGYSYLTDFYILGGLLLQAGAGNQLVDVSSNYNNVLAVVPTSINAKYVGKGVQFTNTHATGSNAVSIDNSAAVFECDSCQITDSTNAASQGISWTATGKAILKGNTTATGGATGGALYNVGQGAAQVYIEPTVVFSPVTFPNWTGTVTGPVVHSSTCTGVATSSSTIQLYGMGELTATTCTATAAALGGYVVSAVGANAVLSYLSCTASAGGVNSSSGVVTVFKNGSSTALTATFGTTTSAIDNTHSAAYALGDIISIQFTTQISETLANVKCSVLTI